MSAPKAVTIFGLQAKTEGSYNAGGTTSSTTDGIQLAEYLDLIPSYANAGQRPAPPGSLAQQRRATPTGRIGKGTAKVEPRPFGSAYSASNKPNVSPMMRFAGYDETVVTTAGSEKVSYTPTAGPTSFASGVLDLFARGEQYHLTGVYSDFEISVAKAGDVPQFFFALMGLMGVPIADASVPSITYPTQDPPIASSIGISIGALTAPKVRKIGFKAGRKIQDRLDMNGTTHGGFGPERRMPQLDITIEALPLTTSPFLAAGAIDPYQLWESANANAIAFQFGSVQYKRIKFAAPAAQLMAEPKLDKEAQAALWTLSFQLNPSAPNLVDDHSITFD
jgi:hypothetical protein